MITDIVEDMWMHHGRVDMSLARNWFFEYAACLGDLIGIPLIDKTHKVNAYLVEQARVKAYEMADVVRRNYVNQPMVMTDVNVVLSSTSPYDVARYEWTCGRYKWEVKEQG